MSRQSFTRTMNRVERFWANPITLIAILALEGEPGVSILDSGHCTYVVLNATQSKLPM
jgi:hypothetical protein